MPSSRVCYAMTDTDGNGRLELIYMERSGSGGEEESSPLVGTYMLGRKDPSVLPKCMKSMSFAA